MCVYVFVCACDYRTVNCICSYPINGYLPMVGGKRMCVYVFACVCDYRTDELFGIACMQSMHVFLLRGGGGAYLSV